MNNDRGEKCCIFAVLYRSPSQNKDVFDSFSKNFEFTPDKFVQIKFVHNNPFLSIVIGDLDAKFRVVFILPPRAYITLYMRDCAAIMN